MSTARGLLRKRFAMIVRDDRGDVPGWVMVTLMTAGLVIGLWAVAGNQLEGVFTRGSAKSGCEALTSSFVVVRV